MKRFLFIVLLLAGCATGPNNPPTALEQRLFTIQTNYTPQVQVHTVIQTNFVAVPVVVTQTNTVTVTNEQSMLIPTPRYYFRTNTETQTVLQTNIVLQTNQSASYVLTPNQLSKDITNGAGAVAAPFGYGGLAVGVLGGLFGLWGKLRSTKANAASEVMAQIIETGSELMKTTPQGAVLADKWKTWMIAHQAQEGVIEQVSQIVSTAVDNGTAKDAANQLVTLANQVKAG